MDDKNSKAILALEDGTLFYGTAIGAIETNQYSCGELVFNTSITGYQEIITDPSYCEQIILFTQPHIGNVGVNQDDIESNRHNKIWSKGIVVKSLSLVDSSWRSNNSLNKFLCENNIIGIANVDTRELTNRLRNNGAQKSCIYIVKEQQDIEQAKKEAVAFANSSRTLNGLDLAKEVSVDKLYQWQQPSYSFNKNDRNDNTTYKYHVVVYDFGVKQQILKLLIDRGCSVTVVPAQTSVEEVLKLKPDGILLSNGPGDPKACDYAIAAAKEFINKSIPVFGICLGFQILALALGAKTEKMKFGHHGGNHPVQDVNTKQVLITSQNHGFMVVKDSISKEIEITHQSLFDKTIQGIKHRSKPVFGFQGHPEASPGPNDIEYLFDVFIENITANQVGSSKNTKVNQNKKVEADVAIVQTGQ